MSKEYKDELSMSIRDLNAKGHPTLKDLNHLGKSRVTITLHSALNIAGV
jgi:hypothetical protein